MGNNETHLKFVMQYQVKNHFKDEYVTEYKLIVNL